MPMDAREIRRIADTMKVWGSCERDYLRFLKLDFDPNAQLLAIKGLLQRNQDADQDLAATIRRYEEHAKKIDRVWPSLAHDPCADIYCESVYQDAAHSMSAVGMLAPFLESAIYQCFLALGASFPQDVYGYPCHARWQHPSTKKWDCHHVLPTGAKAYRNVVDGTSELAAATGLDVKLPADFGKMFHALIAYRNAMFHNGLEWPSAEREKLRDLITAKNWPSDWFDVATSGDEPWIFYMSEQFVQRCLTAADELLDAFALMVSELIEQQPQVTDGDR